MTPALPWYVGAANRLTVGINDRSRQTRLHVSSQSLVLGELGRLGALRSSVSMPLCRCGTILQPIAARCCVTTQFPRYLCITEIA
jgi:hypothetical protein